MDENTPKPPVSHSEPASPTHHALYGAPPPNLRGQRKRTLGTYLWPVGILVVVGIGVMYIIGHNGDGGSTQAQGGGGRRGGIPNGYTPVSAVTATLGDMPVYLDALGTVTPTATVTVRSQISGVLQSVAFTEGQMVQKGQFLAQVDPRPYQAALLQAQGALAKDQATLVEAKKDLERYKTLVSQDSISKQTLDAQVSTVGQLEGTVQSDQAAVQTQQLNLIYAHITAPMAGRVGLRQVDPGNYVTSGDSNGIVAITGESPIDVAFTIPEDQVQTVIGRFSGGKTKLPVSVMDRTQAKVLATGSLLSLDNLIDTTTGTLRAKARFANTDGSLFPSQFVNVRVLVDTLHNVVVVPSSAILRGQQGLFVYTANARGAVHVTPVTTGPTDGDNTAILSGVSPGQQVVTDGTDRLREGACVVVPSAQGGAGGYGGHRHGGPGGASGAGSSTSGDAPKEGFFGHLFGGASSSAAAGAKAASPCGGGSGGGHHHGAGASDTTAPAGGEAATSGGPATSAAAAGPAGGWPHKTAQDSADQAGTTTAAPTAAAGEGGWHGNGGSGQGGGGGRMAAMLQELNLTPDQQSKANAIMAQARTQAQAADDPEAKRQIFMASQQQIQAILTPEQNAKLKDLRAAQKAQQGAQNGQQQ
jgi:multidrug efflux system membrane fusion protein